MTQNNNQKNDDLGVSFETPVADTAANVPAKDSNIILPTFRKNAVNGATPKMRTDVKVQPVIMRSFQQDLKEAVLRDRKNKELRQSNNIQGEGKEEPIVVEPRIPKLPKAPAAAAPIKPIVSGGVSDVAPVKTGEGDMGIEKGMVFVEKKAKPFVVSPSDVTFHAQNKPEPAPASAKEFKPSESEWIAKPGAVPIPVQFVAAAPGTPVVAPSLSSQQSIPIQVQVQAQQQQPQVIVQNIEYKVDAKEFQEKVDSGEIKIPGFYHKPAAVPPPLAQSQPAVQLQPTIPPPPPISRTILSEELLKEVAKAQQVSGVAKKESVPTPAQIPVPPTPMPVIPKAPAVKKEELITTGFPKTTNSVIVNIPIIRSVPAKPAIPAAPIPVKRSVPEELITTGFPKTKNPVIMSMPTIKAAPPKPVIPVVPPAPTPVPVIKQTSSLPPTPPPAPVAPTARVIPAAPKPVVSSRPSLLPPAPVFVAKKEELITTGFPKTKNPVVVNIPIVKPITVVKQPVVSRPVVTPPVVKAPVQHFVPVGFRGNETKPVEKKVEPVVEKPVVKPFVRPVDKPVAKHFIRPLEKQEVKPEPIVAKPVEKPEVKPIEKPVVVAPIQKQEKSHLPSIAEIHQEIKSIQEKATVEKSKIELYITAEDLKSLKSEVVRMDAEIKTFSAQLQSAIGKRAKILEEKASVQSEFTKIQEVLDIVERKEEEIKNNIRVLENEEGAAITADERHAIEEKRWKEEDNRAGIEKKKWEVNVLREKNAETIEVKEEDLARTEQSIEEFNKRITTLIKHRDEKKVKIRLGDIEAKKKEIEDIQVSLLEEKRRLSQLLTSLENKEEDLLKKRKLTEDLKEHPKVNIAESRAYEMSRHEIEKHLRETEQKRWETEKALEKISEKIKKSNEHYETVLKIKNEVQGQLSEYILEE